MGGETRLEGRRRGWYVAGLAAAVLVGVVFALAALGGAIGVTESAGVRARAGETFGGDVALVIVSLVIVVVCIAAATHFEHQLRRHQAPAQTWNSPVPAPETPLPWSPSRRSGRRRRYSPGVVAFEAVLFTGLSVGMVVGAVVTHSDANRSAFVQHHGVLRYATVERVRNVYHSSRGGGYYTADVYLSLSPAVDGRSATVAHYPGRVRSPVGSRSAVLVDPRHPGYAEFPGAPATTRWSWLFLAGGAVLAAVAAVVFGRAWLRLRAHRRAPVSPP